MIEIDGYTDDAICQYFNENYPQFGQVTTNDIVSVGIEDSFLIVLMDCGTKGIPKIKVAYDEIKSLVNKMKDTEMALLDELVKVTEEKEGEERLRLEEETRARKEADEDQAIVDEIIFAENEAIEMTMESIKEEPEMVKPKVTNGRRKRGTKK